MLRSCIVISLSVSLLSACLDKDVLNDMLDYPNHVITFPLTTPISVAESLDVCKDACYSNVRCRFFNYCKIIKMCFFFILTSTTVTWPSLQQSTNCSVYIRTCAWVQQATGTSLARCQKYWRFLIGFSAEGANVRSAPKSPVHLSFPHRDFSHRGFEMWWISIRNQTGNWRVWWWRGGLLKTADDKRRPSKHMENV